MEAFTFPLILDGATGTLLQAAGMPQGVCPEQWILENPDVLVNIQRGYMEAGSNIIYAPTFGANSVKLGKFGLADQVESFNRRLVALSRTAAEGKAYVAGDISPLGLFLAPMGDATFDEFVDVYREQAAALEAAGVDLFVAETFMTIPELRAAVLAIREVSDKPIFATITVDENGKTLMGTDALAAMTIMENMGITAFGLNCSSGPDKMLETIRRLSPYTKLPLIVKPNAGLPHMENGTTVFDLCPHEFAAHTPEFMSLGVGVLGGCCGTTAEHIACLKQTIAEQASAYTACSYRESAEEYLASTEKDVFFIDAAIDISGEIKVTSDFAEDLLDAEEEGYAALKLRIDTEEALAFFDESQYMIRVPVCIVSDDEALFENAIRLYHGRAIYDGSADLSDNCIERCVAKYGLILL